MGPDVGVRENSLRGQSQVKENLTGVGLLQAEIMVMSHCLRGEDWAI